VGGDLRSPPRSQSDRWPWKRSHPAPADGQIRAAEANIAGVTDKTGARYDAEWGNLFQNPSAFIALMYQGV
jgi:hypothetical protein